MVEFIIYNMPGLDKKFKIMGIPIIAGGVLGVLVLISTIIYYLNDIQKQNMKNIILEKYYNVILCRNGFEMHADNGDIPGHSLRAV